MTAYNTAIHETANKLITILGNQTILCAESCTGGQLAGAITAIAGASRVFWGSLVVYDNHAKQDLLYVSPATIAIHGAVSNETCCEMLGGLQTIAKRNNLTNYITTAITGVAGPGASEQKPAGLVYIGYATPNFNKITKYMFGGNRAEIQAQAVLETLKLMLILEPDNNIV